jgi:hypothetical protein
MPTDKLFHSAAVPFVLHLKEPYLLTRDILQDQIDQKLQRKKQWFHPSIKFLSAKDNTVKLLIAANDLEFEITVYVEPYELHASCSCGTKVETICYHAFKTFDRLIVFRGTTYFQQFIKNGLYEIASANRKYFNIKKTETGIDITTKKELGSAFKLTFTGENADLTKALDLPYKTIAQETVRVTDLTYLIVYPYRDYYLPFLVPCIGILNKVGTDIKGFYNFGVEQNDTIIFTDEQQQLNDICREMYKRSGEQSGSLLFNDTEGNEQAIDFFKLWEQALPLLYEQPYIYRHLLYRKRELKGRPAKNRTERILLSKETPRLYFTLTDRGAFYHFELNISIKGKALQTYNITGTFFVWDDTYLYMLSSLQEAGLIEWMKQYNFCITVFKEYFEDFDKEYLALIRPYYIVENKKP